MFLFLSRYLLFPIVWPPIVCSLTLIPIFFLMSPILSPVSFPFLLSPFFYTLSPVSVPFLYILSLSLSSIPCPCPLSPVPVLFEFLNYISVLAAVCMTNYQLVVKEKTSTKTTLRQDFKILRTKTYNGTTVQSAVLYNVQTDVFNYCTVIEPVRKVL